jgi:hypothetical protein
VRRIVWTLLLLVSAIVIPTGIASADATEFTLATTVGGLYPGADVQVPVRVHNPMPYDLAVHSADVRVGDASSTCTAANLRASSFSGDVVAAAHGDATLPIRLHMLGSSPDACQGATFPLTLTGSGAPLGGSGDNGGGDGGGAGGFAFTGGDPRATTVLGAAALIAGLLLLAGRRRGRAAGVSS